MINNLRAHIARFSEMSWPERINLKSWMKYSRSGFDPENFNSPSLQVASVTNEEGDVVCYAPIESVLLVRAPAFRPNTPQAEARKAGDVLDRKLEIQAQRAGINKYLIMVSANHQDLPDGDFKLMRVYERLIAPSVSSGGMGLHHSPQAAHLLN